MKIEIESEFSKFNMVEFEDYNSFICNISIGNSKGSVLIRNAPFFNALQSLSKGLIKSIQNRSTYRKFLWDTGQFFDIRPIEGTEISLHFSFSEETIITSYGDFFLRNC